MISRMCAWFLGLWPGKQERPPLETWVQKMELLLFLVYVEVDPTIPDIGFVGKQVQSKCIYKIKQQTQANLMNRPAPKKR